LRDADEQLHFQSLDQTRFPRFDVPSGRFPNRCPSELCPGYDIPASEIEAGMELHLPCSVKVGQNNGGYKTIEEFLPEAAA
jgi:hypothetical protein